MRRRLDLAFALVVTAAVVVGLAQVVRPDPSKLPATTILLPAPEHREVPCTRPPSIQPKVPPELAAAAARGDLETMERLYRPEMLEGMLAAAADLGDLKLARWLLDHGADVHEQEGSATAPILLADEHPEIVALLLARGAAEPPLAIAAGAGARNAVLRLLAAHAPVNPPDASPLHEAVATLKASAETKTLIVDKLLAAGADPNREWEGDGDETPLTAAVRSCYDPDHPCIPVVRLLVARGARTSGEALAAAMVVDAADRDRLLDLVLTHLAPGATAIALARMSSLEPWLVAKLAARGVDWGWHDGEEDAALPLVAAVGRGDREAVAAMLAAGAPVNRQFKDGSCALGAALSAELGEGSGEGARMVELLLAHGADVNLRLPDGRTPLFAAAETGDVRTLHALLDRGARVGDVVLDTTALDAAEEGGHLAAARVLHARGARRASRTGPPRRDE
jgi:ankyrin repeat protein